MQYFVPKSCEYSSRIKSLERKLAETKKELVKSNEQILTMAKQNPGFCEESLQFANDDFTKFYMDLPNVKVVKAIFEHVSKTLSTDGTMIEAVSFQEFMCVLLKLRLNSPIVDLAYRFRVSMSTVSRIF